jgi:hypothetical protein
MPNNKKKGGNNNQEKAKKELEDAKKNELNARKLLQKVSNTPGVNPKLINLAREKLKKARAITVSKKIAVSSYKSMSGGNTCGCSQGMQY